MGSVDGRTDPDLRAATGRLVTGMRLLGFAQGLGRSDDDPDPVTARMV